MRTEITGFTADFEPGGVLPEPQGERARLVYAPVGCVTLDSPEAAWKITPTSALLVPAGLERELTVLEATQLHFISVAANGALRLPRECYLLQVSPVLRELILRFSNGERAQPACTGHLEGAFLEELRMLTALERTTALPAHRRLRALCNAFLEEPGSTASLAEWAARFGMTRRSLARSFRRELHMTFGTWRRAARVEEARRRLLAGQTVTAVALDLGYESLSAFTAMFRRTAGVPPSKIARDNFGNC